MLGQTYRQLEVIVVDDGSTDATRATVEPFLADQRVRYVQLPSVTVEAATPVTVNVDGESARAERLEYRARAQDLLLHVAHLPGQEG